MNNNNVHGFNDVNNNNNANTNSYRPVQMISAFDVNDNVINPREEKFIHVIKQTCCPFLILKSVICVVSLLDVILYVITLCFGVEMDPTQLLAPKYSTLDSFGMKINYKIYNGQIWRWISFGVLHANLVHVVFNMFSQLIIGSLIERAIGHKQIAILYICSSIGGGMFSSCVSSDSGVGASVAIFGIVAAYFGYMILNWNYLDEVQGSSNKYCNLIIMVFIVIMNISYGFTNERIDNYGHIGGLIFGFLLSFVIITPFNENDGLFLNTKMWYKISVGMLVMLYVGCACLFYSGNYK